jgi:hypothetical protein
VAFPGESNPLAEPIRGLNGAVSSLKECQPVKPRPMCQ